MSTESGKPAERQLDSAESNPFAAQPGVATQPAPQPGLAEIKSNQPVTHPFAKIASDQPAAVHPGLASQPAARPGLAEVEYNQPAANPGAVEATKSQTTDFVSIHTERYQIDPSQQQQKSFDLQAHQTNNVSQDKDNIEPQAKKSEYGQLPDPHRGSPRDASPRRKGGNGEQLDSKEGRACGDSVPIEDHGVIGDLRTVALVALTGTIDWLCFPNFDSPSVFAALLDPGKGGHWSIAPKPNGVVCKQFYWPDTNVLVTRFYRSDGVAEIIDFMPLKTKEQSPHVAAPIRRPSIESKREVIRRVRVVRGKMSFNMECFPAFNYARDQHDTKLVPSGAFFTSADLSLTLSTDVKLIEDPRGVRAQFDLQMGESAVFTLCQGHIDPQVYNHASSEELFRDTVCYWRRWLAKCTYTGRWREMVQRSALALKLMTYEPTGAIVAAPTCSLPESPGGSRNWDYRFVWLRDAAFTVYAFLRVGFKDEACAFMRWIEARCSDALERNEPLSLMYSIDGSKVPTEVELNHLSGFGGARPVRIGNAAADQLQLDIYGELMDSVYLYNKYGAPISYDFWCHLRRLVDWVCEHWMEKDEGIWEVRGGRRHFVYSKLMCWVAVDRAIRLADRRSLPANRVHWLKVRDEIYMDIMTKGWDPARKSFVQSYGASALDAANLLMPLVFFISPVDPRMLSTLEDMCKPPSHGGLTSDGLVFRYDTEATLDGISGSEGTFNLCSFWLVEAMTRASASSTKYLEEARLTFERMLGYANHVGLYAEQTGLSGEALGNFPQALTHLSLISSAFNLDRTLGRSD